MNHIDTMKLALEALESKYIVNCGAWRVQQDQAITALREALAEQPAQKCSYPYCGCNSKAWCKVERNEALDKMAENAKELGLDYEPAQPEPKFFTHCVDQPCDWSEWVCPEPKSYLMKCCDCGLVHEAEFGVVRYKSDTDREDCDFVNDPNLQAVFRMRRSEQWSPADTAHRAGGLTMEQPAQQQDADHEFKNFHRTMCERFGYTHDERDWKRDQVSLIEWIAKKVEQPALEQQEPVAWMDRDGDLYANEPPKNWCPPHYPLYTTPPAAQPSKPLTDEQIDAAVKAWFGNEIVAGRQPFAKRMRAAIEAAHGIKEKNT